MIFERMATELGLSREFIANLAATASYEYKRYTVKKNDGREREIFQPSRKLKPIQVWLLRNVLEQLPIHDAAMAYRFGRSIYDNASRHAQSRYLLRIDLQNFFPSIKASDFENYTKNNTQAFDHWTDYDKKIVTALIFRNGQLTIGAPSSPSLSNVLCYELDVQLSKLAVNRRLVYTRYADDLFFSSIKPNVLTSIPNEVKAIVEGLNVPATLKVNQKKTRHSSKRGRRQVTGIVLGSDGRPHISRSYKRKIRSMVHRFDSLTEDEQGALPGMIFFVAGEEPGFLNSLIAKYGFELINRVTTLKSLPERQRIHLPKMRPTPPKKSGPRSSREILVALLKRMGYAID